MADPDLQIRGGGRGGGEGGVGVHPDPEIRGAVSVFSNNNGEGGGPPLDPPLIRKALQRKIWTSMQTQLHQYSISIQINKKVELIAKTPERVVVPGVGHVLSFV